MLNEHFTHILLFLIPLFLGLILFRQQIQIAFNNSFKKGLGSFFIILLVIQLGFSQPAMAFHHSQSPENNHSCCIIQPLISSAEPVVLLQIPQTQVITLSAPCPQYPAPLSTYTSRAPPVS